MRRPVCAEFDRHMSRHWRFALRPETGYVVWLRDATQRQIFSYSPVDRVRFRLRNQARGGEIWLRKVRPAAFARAQRHAISSALTIRECQWCVSMRLDARWDRACARCRSQAGRRPERIPARSSNARYRVGTRAVFVSSVSGERGIRIGHSRQGAARISAPQRSR